SRPCWRSRTPRSCAAFFIAAQARQRPARAWRRSSAQREARYLHLQWAKQLKVHKFIENDA
ncbi:hypothetical protein, partial [Phytopseudomonas flavescens]|uniref:hypothetical protein n=1 Tax=Phytopseudomonas flavescens TaxID=29435 RepID=UPI001C3F548F